MGQGATTNRTCGSIVGDGNKASESDMEKHARDVEAEEELEDDENTTAVGGSADSGGDIGKKQQEQQQQQQQNSDQNKSNDPNSQANGANGKPQMTPEEMLKQLWKCEACGYLGNKLESRECFQCHTPKPLSKEEKSRQEALERHRLSLARTRQLRIKLLKGESILDDDVNGHVYCVIYVNPEQKHVSRLAEINSVIRAAAWLELMRPIGIPTLVDKRLHVDVHLRDAETDESMLIGYGDVKLDATHLSLDDGETKSVTIPLRYKRDGKTQRLWRGDPDDRRQATVTVLLSYRDKKERRASVKLNRARSKTSGGDFSAGPMTDRSHYNDDEDNQSDSWDEDGNNDIPKAAKKGHRRAGTNDDVASFASLAEKAKSSRDFASHSKALKTRSATNTSFATGADAKAGQPFPYKLSIVKISLRGVIEILDGTVHVVMKMSSGGGANNTFKTADVPSERDLDFKGPFGPLVISDFTNEKLLVEIMEVLPNKTRSLGVSTIRLSNPKINLSVLPKQVSVPIKTPGTGKADIVLQLVESAY